ncbi:DUF4279 domain-containing protein [Sphingosinicella sp. LY1275]|uniref:DUF4279 domain-containing protein n=1 Tax=Sphingosinicella sp. LY1275 TaxID=3095379 RepID=UPI002ADEC2E3|nr:DUF4279 domain-containing protein [Sphingosinicella sp. LY1275]MEA1014452.1 DUF4279 domain-containing protein [Sphingosinicella sp. LY1275]
MGPVRETKLTLRFNGDDLDPEELSERLGAVPTSAVAKGEVWLTANGAERVAATGSWRLRVAGASSEDLDDQINRLFGGLTPSCETWRDLAARYQGNLFVGLFLGSSNEGLTIKPDTAQAVGARGLELQLDIYGTDLA